VKETQYELQHRAGVKGQWYRSRKLGTNAKQAHEELDRTRGMAQGLETDVQYQVVRTTTEVLTW
jgi:hypothetical protein